MSETVNFTINFGGNAIMNAKELTTVTGKLEAKIRDLSTRAANASMEADRLNKEADALPDTEVFLILLSG